MYTDFYKCSESRLDLYTDFALARASRCLTRTRITYDMSCPDSSCDGKSGSPELPTALLLEPGLDPDSPHRRLGWCL